jgi:hypothetical protein
MFFSGLYNFFPFYSLEFLFLFLLNFSFIGFPFFPPPTYPKILGSMVESRKVLPTWEVHAGLELGQSLIPNLKT